MAVDGPGAQLADRDGLLSLATLVLLAFRQTSRKGNARSKQHQAADLLQPVRTGRRPAARSEQPNTRRTEA